MFSSMFVLFLAVSMVSHVFSRSVLLVAFDNISADLISTKMPDLNYDGAIGRNIVRPKFLKIENPTTPFPTLHTVATGLQATAHGVIANKMFDEKGEEMFNTNKQFTYYNSELQPLWTEAVLAGIRTATSMWPGANFLMHNTKPNIVEEYEYKTGDDWKSRTTKIKEWFTRDKIKFGMAYFEDTNKNETLDTYVDKVQNAIKELYGGLKDVDVDIIIMSHGAMEIPTDHVLNIDDYVPLNDCNCKAIVEGPISFVKFNNAVDFRNNYLALKKIKDDPNHVGHSDYGKKFEVYESYWDSYDLLKWHLNVFRHYENILIFIASNGYTFDDKNKYNDVEASGVNILRENGYDRNDLKMNGMLLLMGPSFKKNLVNYSIIKLTEVYQLTKRLLGLNRRASKSQKFENITENMKQLLQLETLKRWNIISRDFVESSEEH